MIIDKPTVEGGVLNDVSLKAPVINQPVIEQPVINQPEVTGPQKGMSAEEVTALPADPKVGGIYALTAQDGEFAPGLYSFTTSWVCMVPFIVTAVVPSAADSGTFMFLSAANGGLAAGIYLRVSTTWVRFGNELTFGTAFPSKASVGQSFFLTAANGGNARGLYLCYAADAWTAADTKGLEFGATLPANPKVGQVFLLTADQGQNLKGVYACFAVDVWSSASSGNGVQFGTTLPTKATVGQAFFLTADQGATKRGMYLCYTVDVWSSVATATPYDIAFSAFGTPAAGATCALLVIPRKVSLKSSLPGSFLKALVNPSADTTFSLRVNNVEKATVRITSAGSTTFTMASDLTLNAGDMMSMVAPAALNGISDFACTLAGVLAD